MHRRPENLRQPHDRYHAAVDDLPEHNARPDRGQLIHVADEQQAAVARQRPQQAIHQRNVHHRHFVQRKQIAVERVGFVSGEAARDRLDFLQSVNRLGFHNAHQAVGTCLCRINKLRAVVSSVD